MIGCRLSLGRHASQTKQLSTELILAFQSCLGAAYQQPAAEEAVAALARAEKQKEKKRAVDLLRSDDGELVVVIMFAWSRFLIRGSARCGPERRRGGGGSCTVLLSVIG